MHGSDEIIIGFVIVMVMIIMVCCVDEFDDVIEGVEGLSEFSLLGCEDGVVSVELEIVLGGDVELVEDKVIFLLKKLELCS